MRRWATAWYVWGRAGVQNGRGWSQNVSLEPDCKLDRRVNFTLFAMVE